MLLFGLLAVQAGFLVNARPEDDKPRGCLLEDLFKRGFKVKSSRPPLDDVDVVKEGHEFAIECADGYIDNNFSKQATKAKCECMENHFNQTMCYIKPKAEGFMCISEDVCPLPMWQGARTHTVKAVDDDWALLSFKLRKDNFLKKYMEDPDFSWDQRIPKDQNWTIVLACPFNVLGVEYDIDPEKDELTEMVDEGVRMMKDCRGDDMERASMQRNSHRRRRKEKKMARLARKAAREGRNARKNGDFTDKLCKMIKEDEKLKNPDEAQNDDEFDHKDKCQCDRQTWRGRKYIGRVSSIDGRVTSSSRDGRMWTIVSKGKGPGGVNGGSREFKIAIDMLNGANPLKWKTTKEMKQQRDSKGPANQYTCELGIIKGHYPHLAPCLAKFHQHDIYRHMKDYNQMKKMDLLPDPTEEPTRKPHTHPTDGPTKPPTKPPTGPDSTSTTRRPPLTKGPPDGTPKGFGQRRDPFGAAFVAHQSLFSDDFEE